MGKTLVSTRLEQATYEQLQDLGRRLERKAVVEYLDREQKETKKGRQAA